MQIHITETEQYILLKEFFEENADAYNIFWRDLAEKHKGWQVDLVYNNSTPPTEFLTHIGAEKIDADIIAELTSDYFKPHNTSYDIVEVSENNFAQFALLHQHANPDMYWTSSRIAKIMNHWRIYMHGRSYVLMSLWANEVEIFALEMGEDIISGVELLTAAAQYALQDLDKTKVLFFISEDSPTLLQAAQKVGFIATGTSMTYRVDALY